MNMELFQKYYFKRTTFEDIELLNERLHLLLNILLNTTQEVQNVNIT